MQATKASSLPVRSVTPTPASRQPVNEAAGLQPEVMSNAVHHFSEIPLHAPPVRPGITLPIQCKLTVNQPNDPYEQEADAVADKVMRMPDTKSMQAGGADVSPTPVKIQKKCAECEEEEEKQVQRKEAGPQAAGPTPADEMDWGDSMFRSAAELMGQGGGAGSSPAEAEVQRSGMGKAPAVGQGFQRSLEQSIQNGGESLAPQTRSFMESRMGWDLSSVRIHHNEGAHQLAKNVNARAFTVGSDIFFARSEYQPQDKKGQHLLAHELTHTMQQSGNRVSRMIQRLTTCNSYKGYNSSAGLDTYNCAGLALRTYADIAPASKVPGAIMSNFSMANSPGSTGCAAGDVKFWLWEYDLGAEDDKGNTLAKGKPDFHVVAGRVGSGGADPTDVYSKNGHRPVYGPGTGPGFKPPTREPNTSNDKSETPKTLPDGTPIIKVRSNMTESLTCAKCL